MAPPLRAVAALVAALTLAGPPVACGTPCDRIRADRDRFLARRAAAPADGSAPHIVVAIPFALANRVLAERLGAPRPVPLTLPGLGSAGRFVERLTLVPRSVTLRPAPDDRVGVRIVVAVRVGRAEAASVTFDGDLRLVVDPARGRLDLVARPADLRDLRPRLGADAREQIAAAIARALPRPARAVLRPDRIAALADRVVEELVARGWGALRGGPLADLDALARVSFAVPGLPVAHIAPRSVGDARRGHLELAITTTLPVARSLAPDGPGPRPRGERVAIRLSGAAAAELGNHGMTLGVVPDRFDPAGHPVEDGPFEARLAWERGPRPLKVLLWQLAPVCIAARLGGAGRARVADATLALAFTDGAIEEVRGPPAVEIGAWFHGLWSDALTFSVETTAAFELAIAGETIAGRLRSVRLVGDVITATLDVHPGGR